jgi:hypothetical protein
VLYESGRFASKAARMTVMLKWIIGTNWIIRIVIDWTRGIHPAIVKEPVSVSVVGNSSHVKGSVSSINRPIASDRNLKQHVLIL